MGYFECYGIGIVVGDFLEVYVVLIVMNKDCKLYEDFLFIGVVKMNIGYSEVVSGFFVLIKVIFIVECGLILFVCGFVNLSLRIKWDDW